MFLIVVDAYSRWLEAIVMRSKTVEHTMDALRTVFARCGLPEQLVSDNGPNSHQKCTIPSTYKCHLLKKDCTVHETLWKFKLA